MGTTDRSPNDDAQNDTSSSTSSGNEYGEEKEDVGCFVIEINKKGNDEIGSEDIAAAYDDGGGDTNQVNENEIEENKKDKTPPPPINRVVLMDPADTEDGSRSVIIQIKNEQTVNDCDTVEMGSSRISSYSSNEKTICRICHLGSHEINQSLEDSETELIQLGCGCKDELGFSHMQCAETWFKQKGNIRCEICGMIAKNIRSNVINVEEEMRRIYMVELSDMRFMEAAATANNMNFSSVRENSHKCHRTICNILMIFFILLFFLPWFLHADIV